jgi:uncharacterized protein
MQFAALIDHHVHLYWPAVNADPAGWAAQAGEGHWAQLCARRRKNGTPVQGFPDVAELLRAMDVASVTRAVLLGWYWERAETCAAQNRFYARCVAAHPDRLAAWATITPHAPAAVVRAELARARAEGLTGLGELSPQSVGAGIDAPGLAAAFACAAEWDWPVNLHVTDPLAPDYPGKVETPWQDFAELLTRWENVRCVLAHWAGGYDVREFSNAWVDTAAAPLLYGAAHAAGASGWGHVGRTVRAAQVLWGSDFPLDLMRGSAAEGVAAGWSRFAAEARAHGLAGCSLG